MSVAPPAHGRHVHDRAPDDTVTPAGESGPWSLRGLVLCLGVALVALLVRLWRLPTAYDLFIDEVTYASIVRQVAVGEGAVLHGEPFFLHPAGVFWVLAAALGPLGLQDAGLAETAYGLRVVPAVTGALTPVLLALVVRAVTRSWLAAGVAGAVLATEPFLLRFDSRVLLEAQAMALGAAALLVTTRLARHGRHGPRELALAVVAGLLACASLLSKETYAFVSVLPLVVLLLTGWAVPRRTSAVALGTAVVGYAVYVASIAADGLLAVWFAEKTRGVGRLLGLVQETGFNREGSPGFVDRLLANLAVLGSTYLLIALGGLATVWLAWRAWRGPQPAGCDRGPLVALLVWVACADAHVGYALTLGTLEEQMFYVLVATAVPVLTVAATSVALAAGSTRVTAGLLVVAALVVAWQGAVWWRIRSVPDDGYLQLLRWTATELPDGARIATTEETLQFVLDDTLVSRLETGAEVRDFEATHVLVVSELVQQGYSAVDTALRSVIEQGEVVFRSDTRTTGEVLVVEVAPPGP